MNTVVLSNLRNHLHIIERSLDYAIECGSIICGEAFKEGEVEPQRKANGIMQSLWSIRNELNRAREAIDNAEKAE